MKKVMIIMVLGALVACLAPANAQEWRSTSTMRGAGSPYAPQVTRVGAATASSMASPATAPAYSSGPRRGYDADGNWTPDASDLEYAGDTGQSGESPIGDAVLPLMAMAAAFCGVIYLRKRKAVKE